MFVTYTDREIADRAFDALATEYPIFDWSLWRGSGAGGMELSRREARKPATGAKPKPAPGWGYGVGAPLIPRADDWGHVRLMKNAPPEDA